MDESNTTRSTKVVAQELGISTATLRRWTEEFTDYLSTDTIPGNGRSQRHFEDEDLSTLIAIKELVNEGLTYEQVRNKLNGRVVDMAKPEIIHQTGMRREAEVDSEDELEDPTPNVLTDTEDSKENPSMELVAGGSGESPAIAFLTNTLATLSDSQKSILNSQAANRELLGVLLQDNFNLKEENNRLRERILEVERDVAKYRQDEEWRREALRQELESKIASASQLAREAMTTAQSIEMPEIKTVETKPGCLGRLFGRGSTQVVTTVPVQKKQGKSRPASAFFETSSQPGAAPNHPKPTFPPE